MLKCLSTKILIMCVTYFLLPVSPAFAHLMLIEPVEEGVVKVVFDDGTIARHAEVAVYDENGKAIKRGDVGGDGKFSYSPEDAKLLVADDGFGHRAEYVVGEDPYKALPRGPTIALVLAGFALIAGVFHYRVKKKNDLKPLQEP